jgi:hypothetical protein
MSETPDLIPTQWRPCIVVFRYAKASSELNILLKKYLLLSLSPEQIGDKLQGFFQLIFLLRFKLA